MQASRQESSQAPHCHSVRGGEEEVGEEGCNSTGGAIGGWQGVEGGEKDAVTHVHTGQNHRKSKE